MANSALDNYYVNVYGPSGLNILQNYWPCSEASGNLVDLISGLTAVPSGTGNGYGVASILPTTDGKTAASTSAAIGSSFNTSANFGGFPKSYEAWVKFTAVTANINFMFTNGGAADGTWVGYFNSLNWVGMFNNGGSSVAHGPMVGVAGTVYHIVVTSNGTAAGTIAYLNGVALTMTTGGAPGALSSSAGAILGSNYSTGMNGAGEKFAIYNAILTPTQVTNNYNAGLNGPPATGGPSGKPLGGNLLGYVSGGFQG